MGEDGNQSNKNAPVMALAMKMMLVMSKPGLNFNIKAARKIRTSLLNQSLYKKHIKNIKTREKFGFTSPSKKRLVFCNKEAKATIAALIMNFNIF